MKKIITFMLASSLFLIGSGCSNSSKSVMNNREKTQSSINKKNENGYINSMNAPYPKTINDVPLVKTYKGPVPILMYHSIGINPKNTLLVPPDTFQKEMEHLKQANYHALTFEDLEEWKKGGMLPSKPILITFDDGYEDNYTKAYPVLKKLGMKATIFVVSGFVGGTSFLTWDQIREMQNSGVINIGVHTKTHIDLSKANRFALSDQIKGSKEEIEKQIGKETVAFAYPSGRYNSNVVNEVRNDGFDFAVTTKYGDANVSQGLLTLDRIRIPGNETLTAFSKQFP